MLLGRTAEQARLQRLLSEARASRSGAVVVRGEPGIGKSALLDALVERAVAARTVRVCGVEAEFLLPYSALAGILGSLHAFRADLDELQTGAFDAALGHSDRAPDRLSVAGAALALVAAAAREAPLLLLVDDAQWVDTPSLDALLFAARRLAADAVAVVFAVRSDTPADAAIARAGIEPVSLRGLDAGDARSLVEDRSRLRGADAGTVVEAAGGNPLALLEMPRAFEAAGAAGLRPLGPGEALASAFAMQAELLGEQSQRALLVVATAGSLSAGEIARALDQAECSFDDLAPAEQALLVSFEAGRIGFRHPLVRSAIYHRARAPARRAAHAAVAAVLAVGRPERAWHLASAARGPDEQAAVALEQAAALARDRSGFGAAALALERAADLTADGAIRHGRLLAAAEDALGAGDLGRVARLCSTIAAGSDEPPLRLRAALLHGRALEPRDPHAAATLLLHAAGEADREAPELAATILAAATHAQMSAALPAEGTLSTARRAVQAARGRAIPEVDAAYAVALWRAGVIGEAVQRFRVEAAGAEASLQGRSSSALAEHGEQLVQAAAALRLMGEIGRARVLIEALLGDARRLGAAEILSYALGVLATVEFEAGRWVVARACAEEAIDVAVSVGEPIFGSMAYRAVLWLDAARGDDGAFERHWSEARALAAEGRVERPPDGLGRGLLALSAGRPEEAVHHLERADAPRVHRDADLVEALLRAGRADDARREARATTVRARESELPSWLAAADRARGLVDREDAAGALTRSAEAFGRLEMRFEAARSWLALGERLRRDRERRRAREALRVALDTFETLGAPPWEERAREELRATGETRSRPASSGLDELTPRQRRIALAVAAGQSNREIAGSLFLSPKTVEMHLTETFRRLGVRSRSELAALVARAVS